MKTKALRIALYTAWLKGWHQVMPSEISVPPVILQHMSRLLDSYLGMTEADLFSVESLQEKLFNDGIRCANEWTSGSKVWLEPQPPEDSGAP